MACWSYCVPKTSNLERFLQCVTPVVRTKPVPKNSIQYLNNIWQVPGKENIEYFTLGDLWRCYDEWSACGMGTNVVLENGEDVMQFYVPYLSSIQIYANKSILASRIQKEDGDVVEFESDSWSDDSGSDQKSASNSNKSWDAGSEDSNSEQEGALGQLYFEYFETCSPYCRLPLIEKVTQLSQKHPGLMTLRSVDLSPASWMSVAWYPIYQIPTKKDEKDLATCFLTFHTLSSCFQDAELTGNLGPKYVDAEMDCSDAAAADKVSDGKKKGESKGAASLTPFGLATYKNQGDVWLDPDKCDYERMLNLNTAADSWLKQLNVYHHDFNFFSNHSNM